MSRRDPSIEFPGLVHQFMAPQPFLGEEDAATEWEQMPKPTKTFLHTDSFTEFLDERLLYLYGRRGTGKTAIIRMMDYEISRGNHRAYSFVCRIEQEDAFNNLAVQLRLSPMSELPQNELVYTLKQKWQWIFTVAAMLEVARLDLAEHEDDQKALRSFLQAQTIIGVRSESIEFLKTPLQRVTDVLVDELQKVDYLATRAGAALISVTKTLLTPEYTKARSALENILSQEKGFCLVLVDSIEYYNLNDEISQAVRTAMIDVAKEMFDKRQEHQVLVKIAFPSEMYPHLTSEMPEKVETRNIFILWTYKDLVCMVATRYRQMLQGEGVNVPKLDCSEFKEAQKFLYTYLPPLITTRNGIPLDTMAYIISHTQKKPRQVITLLNSILTYVKKKGLDPYSQLEGAWIREGVHARLDILVKGTLDIYERIFPSAEKIIRRALTGTRGHFDYSNLDHYIAEASTLRSEANLSTEDVKRLFLESGVLGIEHERHNVKGVDKVILESLFEYQVKGTLYLTNNSHCVLHPMFYQELGTKIDKNVLTYPYPAEDEEMEALAASGIALGKVGD